MPKRRAPPTAAAAGKAPRASRRPQGPAKASPPPPPPLPLPPPDPPEVADVAARVRACMRCRLCETRTCAVPGEGSGRSGIVLVGEAPGRNEDRTGRPFCGAAGKLLDLALAEARLDRADLFVTSVVKCRPPKNRDPASDEKEACQPYLLEQVRALRPRVLVALGRHGLSGLQGGLAKDFQALAGTFQPTPLGLPVFVSLHPAAVIYRQRWKPDYLRHWREFGGWLRGEGPPGFGPPGLAGPLAFTSLPAGLV